VSVGYTRIGAVAALLALVAGVTAGCGVATQSTPRRIPPSDVPFGLLRARDSTTTSVPTGATSELVVYLVGPDGLAPVTRDVRGTPTARDSADALTTGPTSDEAHAGYRSALVPGAIEEIRVANGKATVELDPEFLQQGRLEQALAIAQMVLTLTELDTVDRVRFLVGGEPLAVAQDNGRTTTAPISRDQVAVPPLP
jgi:hypothetical protein